MDYFESVVIEYIRADRSMFVNTQCCIQINDGENPDTSGPHWYCDAIAVDFKSKYIFLCEITFSDPPNSLLKRLSSWESEWLGLSKALVRDSNLPIDWPIRPWLFIPEKLVPKVLTGLTNIPPTSMPTPKITTLEMVFPWQYRSWNRQGEKQKIPAIPQNMW